MSPKIVKLKSNYVDSFNKTGSISMSLEQFVDFKDEKVCYDVIDAKCGKSIGIINFSDIISYNTINKCVDKSGKIKNMKYKKGNKCIGSFVVCRF